MLEQLVFDYLQNVDLNSPDKQANFLFEKTKSLLRAGRKVAIIYSANNKQALDIYSGYKMGNKIAGKIKGSHQAKYFNLFSELIEKKLQHNLDAIRILPIATIMIGGEGSELVGFTEITRDLTNLKWHLDNGWYVLVLTNSDQMQGEHKQKYQIGGGKAKGFYQAECGNMAFKNTILSYGHFIERFIDGLVRAYGASSSLSISEKQEQKEELESALALYQLIVAAKPLNIVSCLNKQPPKSLAWFVNQQIVQDLQEKSLFELPITDVRFSPSYHLRIYCSNPTVQEELLSLLSAYGIENLNDIAQKSDDITRRRKAKKKHDLVHTIFNENVVRFLVEYCKVPIDILAYYYSQQIAAEKHSAGKLIVIMSHYIQAGNKVYSYEESVANKLFGEPYQQPFESVFRHPEHASVSVREIMMRLKQQIAGNEQNTPQPTAHFYYGPLRLNISSETRRDFGKIITRIKARLIPHCINENDFKEELHDMIWWHYNLFTDSILKYAIALFEDGNIDQKALQKLDQHQKGLETIIQNDMLSQQDDVYHGFLKYWMYVQIAIIAYLKGNIILLVSIASVLRHCNKIFMHHFDNDTAETVSFLLKTCYIESSLNDKNLSGFFKFYVNHFGIAIPLPSQIIFGIDTSQFQMVMKQIADLDQGKFGFNLSSINSGQSDEISFNTKIEEFNPVILSSFISLFQTFSVATMYVEAVNQVNQLLSIDYKATTKQRFWNLLSLKGAIFHTNDNPLVKALEQNRLDLAEQIVKYNLVRCTSLNLEQIELCLNKMPTAAQPFAQKIFDGYLVEADIDNRGVPLLGDESSSEDMTNNFSDLSDEKSITEFDMKDKRKFFSEGSRRSGILMRYAVPNEALPMPPSYIDNPIAFIHALNKCQPVELAKLIESTRKDVLNEAMLLPLRSEAKSKGLFSAKVDPKSSCFIKIIVSANQDALEELVSCLDPKTIVKIIDACTLGTIVEYLKNNLCINNDVKNTISDLLIGTQALYLLFQDRMIRKFHTTGSAIKKCTLTDEVIKTLRGISDSSSALDQICSLVKHCDAFSDTDNYKKIIEAVTQLTATQLELSLKKIIPLFDLIYSTSPSLLTDF